MVITLSRMYGAGAQGVASALGATLDLPVIDRGLPELVATRLGIQADAAEQIVAEPKPLVERILGGLAISSPETGVTEDIDEEVARSIEAAILEAAAAGNCVIVGRAGGIVLRGRFGVFKVFLHGPDPWRAERVREALRCSEREARAEVARVDRARAAYIRERYGVNWLDLTLYDFAIDSSLLGIEGTAAEIASVVRRLSI